jgi:hypothetical protein
MTDFIYHALGICGEHSHPHLLNIGFLALFSYVGYRIISKQFKTN